MVKGLAFDPAGEFLASQASLLSLPSALLHCLMLVLTVGRSIRLYLEYERLDAKQADH